MPSDCALELIDDLYAGALDEARWNRALIAIADSVIRGIDALLLAHDPTNGHVPNQEIHRFDGALLAEYNKSWGEKDTGCCSQSELMRLKLTGPATVVLRRNHAQ